MSERFNAGDIKGVVVRDLRKYADERGWLAELFRHDEIDSAFHSVMAYTSSTNPGVTRGPHEHVDQPDLFCFNRVKFQAAMWDDWEQSETLITFPPWSWGEDNPILQP